MTRPHLSLVLSRIAASIFAAAFLGCGEGADDVALEPDVAPWSKALGGEGSSPQATAVVTGVSGNIALTGTFNGTINFGAGDLVATAQPSFYVAKLTPAGEHVWSARTGGGNDTATSLALDRGGSLLLTGFFDGELDLGTGLLAGEDNLFLARFDASGAPVWSRQVGDPFAWDAANDITVSTADGSAYVTGRAGGAADFGLGPIAESQFQTLFVAKLTASGGALWSRGFGSDGFANGQKIAIDKGGNTIVAGDFSGALNLGGGTLGSFDSYGVFVAKFDPNGGHVWSKGFTTFNSLNVADIAVDPSGNVLLAGNFTGSVDFGGGLITGDGFSNVFLVKFGPGGELAFSKQFGAAESSPSAAGVGVDGEGNLYLGGTFDKTIDFGGGGLVCMGNTDIFWAKFTNAGAMMESRSFGDLDTQALSAMAIDTWGNTVLAGRFWGTVDFGSGKLDAGDQQQLFIARF